MTGKAERIETSLLELVCPRHERVRASIDRPKEVVCRLCGKKMVPYKGLK